MDIPPQTLEAEAAHLRSSEEAVREPGATDAAEPATARGQAEGRLRGLRRRDRELLALLGMCRYLTASQVAALEPGSRTEKAALQRLRRLGAAKDFPFMPALVRPLPYRAFDGEPLQLWGLTAPGCAAAASELARVLRAFRSDVGVVFAEHFVFLTELFVRLARPCLAAGVAPRALPFRWNVGDDVELPWRDRDETGSEKARVIRPDAVLEVPAVRRRFFIECEMGTHTLTPVSPDKSQATVRKLQRYDAYISGFADVPARVSHYRKKYPDGWPCEVIFLVRSESRAQATNDALRACLVSLAGTRLAARALTLEEATAHCSLALAEAPSTDALAPPGPGPGGPSVPVPAPFYGEWEHGAVKDFVLDMTAALAEANALLRRHGLCTVPGPASKAPMLDFLRKAQAEMQRRRGGDGSVSFP